jgi:hypothetical protein
MTIKGVMLSDKEGSLVFYRNYSKLGHTDFEDLAYQLGHAGEGNREFTYIQHLDNRVVFLPLESLFLCLVTSLQSNIIRDQKTLALGKEVVQVCLGSEISVEQVEDNFLELAFGLDDLINMGTANNVTVSQVEDSLRMESSNEMAHKQMLADKVEEQKRKVEEESREIERTNRINEIIEKEKQEIEKQMSSLTKEGIMGNLDSGGVVTSYNNDAFMQQKDVPVEPKGDPSTDLEEKEEPMVSNVHSGSLATGILGKKETRTVKKTKGALTRKGLKLGGKKKKRKGRGKRGKVL